MAELEAQGPEPADTWRRKLPEAPVKLGRAKRDEQWDVEWDGQISRTHALLTLQNGTLTVRRLPEGRNRVFYQGMPNDDFSLKPGDRFVIGKTTFHFLDEATAHSTDHPDPLSELTCGPQELQQVRFVDANERIDALAILPGLIRFSPSDEQVDQRVVDVLLKGIPRADSAAVVWYNPSITTGGEAVIRCLGYRDGISTRLIPSKRLVHEAIRKRRQAVHHSWNDPQKDRAYTVGSDDWAVCAPLPDDPAPGWALYVAGRNYSTLRVKQGFDPQDVTRGDLKFASLVAEIFGSLRQMRDLQRRQTILSQVFSQTVLAAIAQQNIEEVLAPRQTNVTVLMCDLRGSCNIADRSDKDLSQAWERIGEALHIMTNNIIDKEGVIGDFQGDAALGFWGWPHDTYDDQVVKAARAGLAIRKEFLRVGRSPSHPLHGFACGIGIAHGEAIAGKLGTFDQLKIGVFGPVVNRAARLEGMTKMFKAPVLIDEATALALKAKGWGRCRRLARIRPQGMRDAVMVYELLPPMVETGILSQQDCGDYEAALDDFLAGQWSDASNLLKRLPHDGAAAFLTAFMNLRNNKPPKDWDGVIALESK